MPASSSHDSPADSARPHGEPSTVSTSPGVGSANTPARSPSTAQQSVHPLPPEATRSFERYHILAELARGGMGIVYHALDSRLGREVALKVMRAGVLARPEEMERFDREARAIANLNHPHIVPLYDVGSWQGQHFFTMELARAGSLAKHRPRLQQDRRAAVTLLLKVTRALAQIHAQGLLHRDLKPANILMRDDDTPLISDFGLAKAVDVDADLTRTGAAVGTPAYMAPEQAGFRPERIGPATDIWSLGIIGYELVCGARPFAHSDERRLIDAIVQDPPCSPRKAKPGLDRDLETILLKCLEKDPAQRYASADALADDLEAWLAGEPIKARPPGLLRRAGRWARRHYLVAAAAAALVLTAAVVPFVGPEADLATEPAVVAIQDELNRQRPVTLIGDDGERPPCRWIGRGAFVSRPASTPLHATVPQGQQALLLLLPDPIYATYRFEGEVRVDSYPRGTIGLFVGHTVHDGPRGATHTQVVATIHHIVAQAPNEAQPKLYLSLLIPNRAKAGTDHPLQGVQPRAKTPDGWYHIAIEVDGLENMRLTIQDKYVATLARDVRFDIARMLAKRGQDEERGRGVDQVNALVPICPPRGGLGLFLQEGTFSIRNVKVTPKMIRM
jgi:hypothetical protein